MFTIGAEGVRLVALWSQRGPTTTNDDRKGPKTKGEVEGPFPLFVHVIGGSFSGLIIRRPVVRVHPAPPVSAGHRPSFCLAGPRRPIAMCLVRGELSLLPIRSSQRILGWLQPS